MKTCGCQGALPCGCCAGVEPLTPELEFNRPGLSGLQYRAGTYATFFATMQAALSRDHRLDGLATRESSDASIALLDAWATLGDVLTFYQERIANEGFLATATERRSVLELANLIGYRPRPGVSASVFLAYTLEKDAETTIPSGSLVRSVPADGEEQQAFETSEPLEARASWNNLQVRLTRPHTKKSILTAQAVYLKGVVTSVHKGDPLFIQFASDDAVLCRVLDVTPDAAAGYTKVALEEWAPTGKFKLEVVQGLALANRLRPFLRIEDFGLTLANSTAKRVRPILQKLVDALESEAPSLPQDDIQEIEKFAETHPPRALKAKEWLDALVGAIHGDTQGVQIVSVDDVASQSGLLEAPSLAPRSQYHRFDEIGFLFGADGNGPKGDKVQPQVAGSTLATLVAFRPAFRASLASALARATVTPDPEIRVYAVRRTAPFGYNAGPMATTNRDHTITTTWGEWPLDPATDAKGSKPVLTKIDLEKEFDKVDANTLLALQFDSAGYNIPDVGLKVDVASRAAYGLAGKVTRLLFDRDVIPAPKGDGKGDLGLLRPIKVFLATDLLPLAEQPVPDPVCGSDPAIELDGLYDGLSPGRWIILSGEREDTLGTTGVQATELLLIGDVQHRAALDLPGDRMHTYLKTAVPSAYCYQRDNVKIYGNVVKATNGETRKEILGNGDASVPFQQFPLKQPPLTYLAAPTAAGSASTLHTYVNDMEWHDVDTPVGLSPADRRFFTRTADNGTTTVIFGNGVTGARVPTGNANVRASYRNGIGKGGNVKAGQLSILGSKPLGVKEVLNPLRAAGGADKDSRDQIRVNAPLSVTALDRLVSVEDYAHFARTFAGIGKASSISLTDGYRQLVHITIAGIDDIPIDPTSDLFLNLRHALHLYGDIMQPLQLDVRTAKFLVLQAGVRVHPDYPWETMAPKLRHALLDAFQFDHRELGQSAFLSEVLDVLQRVPGVEFVDADKFGSLAEDQLTPTAITTAISELGRRDRVSASVAETTVGRITPAEIAYFTPDVPATIALNQL